MRVEPAQHALDRALEQGAVVDLLDVGGADLVEHVGEDAQFRQRQLPWLVVSRQHVRGGGIGADGDFRFLRVRETARQASRQRECCAKAANGKRREKRAHTTTLEHKKR